MKRLWKSFGRYEKVLIFCGLIILLAGILAWRFGVKDPTIEWAVDVAEPMFIGLGGLSIVLLWAQMRQTAVWNKHQTYHQFFSELPAREKVLAVRQSLATFGIQRVITRGMPLTVDEVRAILAEHKTEADNGLTAVRAMRDYLNDFEEFCAAVNRGLVDDEYARQLEGSRVINAYFGYKNFIVALKAEEKSQLEFLSRSPDYEGPKVENYLSKYYDDLRKTASKWLTERAREGESKQKRDYQRNLDEIDEDGTRRRID